MTDPANFVKDMFPEEVEQPEHHVVDGESQLVANIEQEMVNCEVVTSVDRIHTDKQQQGGEVRDWR